MSLPTSNNSVQPPMHPVRGRPTWEIAYLYPKQGQWDESDYLSLSTNHMVEFDEGCIEILPMPSLLHQLVVRFLFIALDDFVRAREPGVVLFAPLPIRLWQVKYCEPDIVYLRPGRIRDHRDQPDGADLVIEVVSEGNENRDHDFTRKRVDYARAGIAEYWIVDPHERRIVVLTLDNQTYLTHGDFSPGTQATSKLLKDFAVRVDEVFKCVDPDAGLASTK